MSRWCLRRRWGEGRYRRLLAGTKLVGICDTYGASLSVATTCGSANTPNEIVSASTTTSSVLVYGVLKVIIAEWGSHIFRHAFNSGLVNVYLLRVVIFTTNPSFYNVWLLQLHYQRRDPQLTPVIGSNFVLLVCCYMAFIFWFGTLFF